MVDDWSGSPQFCFLAILSCQTMGCQDFACASLISTGCTYRNASRKAGKARQGETSYVSRGGLTSPKSFFCSGRKAHPGPGSAGSGTAGSYQYARRRTCASGSSRASCYSSWVACSLQHPCQDSELLSTAGSLCRATSPSRCGEFGVRFERGQAA